MKNTILWLLAGIILLCIVRVASGSLLHPEMTQTEAFLEYWPWILAALLATGASLFVIKKL